MIIEATDDIMTMKDTTFEDFVETFRTKATDIFNTAGEVIPIWFLQKENGNILAIVTRFDSDLDKDITACAIQDAIQNYKVQRYCFITEMWLVTTKVMPRKYEGPRPSRHPDRKEAVMLVAEDISGRQLSGYAMIHRNHNDGTAMISELKIDPSHSFQEGRFCNLFNKPQSH